MGTFEKRAPGTKHPPKVSICVCVGEGGGGGRGVGMVSASVFFSKNSYKNFNFPKRKKLSVQKNSRINTKYDV